MSKLVKYAFLDKDSGKWIINNEMEHHSIAVPKVCNSINKRLEILLDKACNSISLGLNSRFSKNFKSYKCEKELEDISEEINSHLYMYNEFKLSVEKNIETETRSSPILELKKLDKKSSPINLKGKPTLSLASMYERYDNVQAKSSLENVYNEINNLYENITLAKECYSNMFKLFSEIEANTLLQEMRKLNGEMSNITNSYLFKSFFTFDDSLRGIIIKKDETLNKNENKIKVDIAEIANKFIDFMFRTFLKGINNYRKSEESSNIEKCIEKLKEYKLLDVDDFNIKVLLDLKVLLDIEPSIKASLSTCYKKIGELHSNVINKLFETESLYYLRKYLSEENIFLVDIFRDELRMIHDKLVDINKDSDCRSLVFNNKNRTGLSEKTIFELEVMSKVLQDLLIDINYEKESKEFFYVKNKLHSVNNQVAVKYYVLNLNKLDKCLDLIGGEIFRGFINTCEMLMLALRNIVDNKKKMGKKDKELINVDLEVLKKVGITTGKTSMITDFNKAVEEVLACLGTFLGNSIHTLIKEMLQNLSYHKEDGIDKDRHRANLRQTYELTETVLREFNNENFSDSF